MDDTLLTTEGFSKRFGHVWALQGVGFSLRRGEVLGLIGPNGSGKTTLLECVAGLLPPNSGSVRFRGKALRYRHRKDALFYLPDGISPWSELTVKWALKFFEEMFGAAQLRAADLLVPLNLDGLLLLEYALPEPVSGRIGVWSKTDSVSYFDEFAVTRAAK